MVLSKRSCTQYAHSNSILNIWLIWLKKCLEEFDFNQGFWMIWKYKFEKWWIDVRYFLFLSLISLVCSIFRNEERVVFIAIIVFFPLSCCLTFFLIFNQSSCFLWKLFLLKRFFSCNWYGCLAINQVVFFENFSA